MRTSLLSAAAGLTALLAVAAAPAIDLTTADATGGASTEVTDEPDSRVVVAPVDSGINPYHEFFAVEESSVTEDVLDEFRAELPEGNTLRVIELGASYLADVGDGKYDDIAEGDLAHFAGTNIIARSAIAVDGSPAPDGERPFLPDDSGDTHGTGVSGSVAVGNPEAVIFFVEGTSNEGVAFRHPAVDIVTTSYGFLTAVPLPLDGSHEGVVELGKMHTGATTNDPSLAPVDGTGGPWWVLGVAGFEEGTSEGKQVLSGTFPDVVADFTQDLPYCDVCTEGTQSVGGTSFATPLTAGVASKVLLDARRDAGHLGGITENDEGTMVMVDREGADDITTWDLRRAMEVAAYVPTELDPTAIAETALPVNPALPATQVGWGAITAAPEHEVVANASAYLADGTETAKPSGTCEFMTGLMTFRYVSWDAYVTSPTFGETNATGGSDYVAC